MPGEASRVVATVEPTGPPLPNLGSVVFGLHPCHLSPARDTKPYA
jgi:hypothetical protein